jgi:hypothetical protein
VGLAVAVGVAVGLGAGVELGVADGLGAGVELGVVVAVGVGLGFGLDSGVTVGSGVGEFRCSLCLGGGLWPGGCSRPGGRSGCSSGSGGRCPTTSKTPLEQFQSALRTGHDPLDPKNGLLAVMPWPAFRHMTGRDLDAIYAYLTAIPSATPPPVGMHCKNPGQ